MRTVVKTELIDEYLKEHNMSLTKFCELSKISRSTIKRMIENRNFNSLALFKLAKFLNLKGCEILNKVHDKIQK